MSGLNYVHYTRITLFDCSVWCAAVKGSVNMHTHKRGINARFGLNVCWFSFTTDGNTRRKETARKRAQTERESIINISERG